MESTGQHRALKDLPSGWGQHQHERRARRASAWRDARALPARNDQAALSQAGHKARRGHLKPSERPREEEGHGASAIYFSGEKLLRLQRLPPEGGAPSMTCPVLDTRVATIIINMQGF